MKKFIRVGGVDVQQGLCSIAFNARIMMDGSDLQTQSVELTHGKLYKLLETATDVKEVEDKDTTKFVTFKQGLIEFEIYQRKS